MVKLVEPNYGRIVTLEISKEEPLRQMSIEMLTCIADGQSIKTNVAGNTVTLTFADPIQAEAYRRGYQKL